MTTPEIQPDDQAIIPPYYLLIVALAGALIALVVGLTQPTFTVVGWGGLGIAILALIAWVLMAPEQARAVLTGRTVRFGGTSLIITVVVLIALIAIYTLIRQQNWRIDLTERDTFSLTEESRGAVAVLGADPTLPTVKILAFYSSNQAGPRDRDSLLLEDYAEASAGKIEYEIINPDRKPILTEQLGVSGLSPQYFIATLDENGEQDQESGELISFFGDQTALTNAILRVSAAGDFRAWFISVNNGLSMTGSGPDGLSRMSLEMEQRFDWTNREVGLIEFTAPDSPLTLNDPAVDGEVMIIAGGDTPLAEAELNVLIDFLDNGGKLMVLAAPSLDPESTSLATGEDLSNYLWQSFGLRFRDDIVLDQTQAAFQTITSPVADDLSRSHPITADFAGAGLLIFDVPHSIELADAAPENVVVTELASSSNAAYAKSDIQQLIDGNIEPGADDLTGPLVLAAVAENNETGARVALFGSTSVAANAFDGINNVVNRLVALTTMIWATDFEDYFTSVNIQSAPRLQDMPIFVDTQTGNTINLITTLFIPFGILALGALVWWNNRESAHQGG